MKPLVLCFLALLVLLASASDDFSDVNHFPAPFSFQQNHVSLYRQIPFLLDLLGKVSTFFTVPKFLSSVDPSYSSLPVSYDVRDFSPPCASFIIADQANCASRYSFAAARIASDYQCRNHGHYNLSLSTQQLVSCSKANGCVGAFTPDTLAFIKTNGIVAEQDFG
ncbi:hypothetical protein RCL1_008901 [Eukaryota sp. TZLM3-RCL]